MLAFTLLCPWLLVNQSCMSPPFYNYSLSSLVSISWYFCSYFFFFLGKKKVDLAYIFSLCPVFLLQSAEPSVIGRRPLQDGLCFSGLGSEAVNHTGCSAATDLVLSNPLSTAYLQIKCREALAILANCVWRSDHTLIWYEMFDITSVAHRCILYLSIVVSIHCCMYALLLFLNASFAGIV